MENINYCSFENGVKVCNVSSTLPNCSADNILHSDRRVSYKKYYNSNYGCLWKAYHNLLL